MATTTTAVSPTAAASAAGKDFLPIEAWDHVEFYVGNALQAAHYYRTTFGFEIVAYAGLETGLRDRTSFVLKQNNITFVLTAPLQPESEVALHVLKHGDGVRVIALRVPDVEQALRAVKDRHATIVHPVKTLKDGDGEVRVASIKTYGDTIHTFVQRSGYKGAFLPGFRPFELPAGARKVEPVGLRVIDHMVGNVELRAMNFWVDFYRDVMGFEQLAHFDDKQISTEYSALMSKVMMDGSGRVKFPINEPAEGRRKSQIEEYLEYYRGPGVQHVALLTGDIFDTVRRLRDNGMRFLRVPDTYYEALPGRVGKIKEDIDQMRDLGILFDRDDEGYLLQIFTQPVQDRPTLFYEVIERHGSRGFGIGNFKALFVSIEEEQKRRGNL